MPRVLQYVFFGLLALSACAPMPRQEADGNNTEYVCRGDNPPPGCAPKINVLSGFGRISSTSILH